MSRGLLLPVTYCGRVARARPKATLLPLCTPDGEGGQVGSGLLGDGVMVHQLGMYDSEEAAAQAWDKVAWVYRGKAQGLNFAHLVPEYDTELLVGWVEAGEDAAVVTADQELEVRYLICCKTDGTTGKHVVRQINV
ncbi:hypothetical protein HaLaN_08104 [Haematococcus lacustris]|uniref:AP2/ERF domain-containing protein n=1 Tax=Haematococcus lacustris TaxID=44745 RepID=A0A699Z0H4_HAELA|nr:hypothetical protein HaLaN_08104 [Haematococcus lacustris]